MSEDTNKTAKQNAVTEALNEATGTINTYKPLAEAEFEKFEQASKAVFDFVHEKEQKYDLDMREAIAKANRLADATGQDDLGKRAGLILQSRTGAVQENLDKDESLEYRQTMQELSKAYHEFIEKANETLKSKGEAELTDEQQTTIYSAVQSKTAILDTLIRRQEERDEALGTDNSNLPNLKAAEQISR